MLPITTQRSFFPSCPTNPKVIAILTAIRDAQKSHIEAQNARIAAQEEQVTYLSKAAERMRAMAKQTLYSGLYKGFLGLASAGLEGFGVLKQNEKPTKVSSLLTASGKASRAISSFDPFSLRQEKIRGEKQSLDIEAERSRYNADHQTDSAATATRLQDSLMEQLKALRQ